MFSADNGDFFKEIKSGRKGGFRKPTDLLALPDGRFAVRDENAGIQFFDEEGDFALRVVVDPESVNWADKSNFRGRNDFVGLATDGKGKIFTLVDNARKVICLDINDGSPVATICLGDILQQG